MAFVFAEGAVTRLRREFKLLVAARDVQELCARLEHEAAPTTTWITSVYFDRPGYPLTARARSTPDDCLKVRTKEYFPDVSGEFGRVVLEAKRERNGLTQKQRVWLARSDLRELEQTGRLWGQLPLLDAGPFFPVLAVTYARDVYQRDESWRVTVDRNVAFHPVSREQAFGGRRLTARRLGTPTAREEHVIVEVKHLGEALPAWLLDLRDTAARRFSKFAEGTARLSTAHVDGAKGR